MSKKKQQEFLAAYEPIHQQFERFCRARAFGDMDFRDLMNDSLLIAYKKFEELRDRKQFKSFLFRITSHVVGNFLQKKKTDRMQDAHLQQHDSAPTPDLSTDLSILFELLQELPDVQREAILLFEIAGFSIKEIMEIQGAGESAVKARLKRGRAQLEKLLTEESSLKQ